MKYLQNTGTVSAVLPWPPSVNQLWRAVNGRNILSKKGREFKGKCNELFNGCPHKFNNKERLFLTLTIRPPDKRRRDISNLIKAVEDSLPWYEDDSQIDALVALRGDVDPDKSGFVLVQCGIYDSKQWEQ